ncbi:MAG: cytochrome c oxidase subunit 3 [Myxococcales bacterium]|nr:cytochrome c oxidase subunit 3 [Myxococcales bacterium]MCB9734025.1 cytochrome c oxidase subunit 3 [Deltaproteobacteria bacterium]
MAELHADARLVREPFTDVAHQRAAVSLGMWVFIAQEVLFFGVLFVWYGLFRAQHPDVVAAGGRALDVPLATVMTVTLLVSSFTMVLAVRSAMLGARRGLAGWLAATGLLAVAFLAMKAWEYHHHIAAGEVPVVDLHAASSVVEAGRAQFFGLYFVMTGFHALHVVGGVLVIAWRALAAARGRELPRWTAIMGLGLYWHLVDVVWLFVFPALYLAGHA